MESTPVHLRGQAPVSSECFSGLPTINDMRNVAMLIDGPEALGAAVARIGAQVLAAPMRRCAGVGRLTMMAPSASSRRLPSLTLAPVTISDNGTPRASTRRWCCFHFSLIRRVRADSSSCQGSIHHRPVDALPAPGDALHLVVFGQSRRSECLEEARCLPFERALVDGTPWRKSDRDSRGRARRPKQATHHWCDCPMTYWSSADARIISRQFAGRFAPRHCGL